MLTALTAVEFDFATRQARAIPLEEVRVACERGLSCWVDLDIADRTAAGAALAALGVHPMAINQALEHPLAGRHDVYDDITHASFTALELADGRVRESQLQMVLLEGLVITLHHGPLLVIDQVRENYQTFFRRYAQSLGFLLFDIAGRLISGYRVAIRRLEDQVEQIQAGVFTCVDDAIINDVAELTFELIVVRKTVLSSREVLDELATRRSAAVSPTTQPYLENMVGTLERLAADLSVEREILAETLSLHLGIVSHRTSRVINRLTIINAFFLPLTFLCGVYGMNLKLPEFEWDYGYLYFWCLAAGVVAGLLVLLRRMRWL
jgi:magnesium transporter